MQEDREVAALARLVRQGTIDERAAAYGIALKVISDGRASLDARQEALYEAEVAPLIRANTAADTASARTRERP